MFNYKKHTLIIFFIRFPKDDNPFFNEKIIREKMNRKVSSVIRKDLNQMKNFS